MTQDEASAIHRRLDRQDEKLDRIEKAVTEQAAICPQSRARLESVCAAVWGNGQEGLIRKVERLETVGKIGSRGFWAMVAFVSAVVSGAILAAGSAVWSMVRGW